MASLSSTLTFVALELLSDVEVNPRRKRKGEAPFPNKTRSCTWPATGIIQTTGAASILACRGPDSLDRLPDLVTPRHATTAARNTILAVEMGKFNSVTYSHNVTATAEAS